MLLREFCPQRIKSADIGTKFLPLLSQFYASSRCMVPVWISLECSRIRGTFSRWEIFSSQEIWLGVMMCFASCLCVSTLVRSCSVLQVVILGAQLGTIRHYSVIKADSSDSAASCKTWVLELYIHVFYKNSSQTCHCRSLEASEHPTMSSWKPATDPKTRPPLVNLVWSWARPLAGGREQEPSLILRKMGMQLLTTHPVSISYPWPSGSASVCLSKFTLI